MQHNVKISPLLSQTSSVTTSATGVWFGNATPPITISQHSRSSLQGEAADRQNYSIFTALKYLCIQLSRPIIDPFRYFFRASIGIKNLKNKDIRKYLIKDSIESIQKIRRRLWLNDEEKAQVACGLKSLKALQGRSLSAEEYTQIYMSSTNTSKSQQIGKAI
jgi:hypothetical protein